VRADVIAFAENVDKGAFTAYYSRWTFQAAAKIKVIIPGELMLTVGDAEIIVDRSLFRPTIFLQQSLFSAPRVILVNGGIKATATVTINGEATDDGTGHRLGFVQYAMFGPVTAYYRGLRRADGSILRSTLPQHLILLCHDRYTLHWPFVAPTGAKQKIDDRPLGGPLITAGHPAAIDLRIDDPATVGPTEKSRNPFPRTYHVAMADTPRWGFSTWYSNGKTGRRNYLKHIEYRQDYCTLLILHRPDGFIEQIGYFNWHISWIADFKATEVDPEKRQPSSRNSVVIAGESHLFSKSEPTVLFSVEGNIGTFLRAEDARYGKMGNSVFSILLGSPFSGRTCLDEVEDWRPDEVYNDWQLPDWP
jgi:hypothetical protein